MILVTGATGFVGAELSRQIAASGSNMVCTKRNTSTIPSILVPYTKQIKWIDADLLDIFALDDAMQNITQVYHCAAKVSFNPADNAAMIKTNVEGTANLVNLCMRYDARLLQVSSVAAVGEAKPGNLITEKNHLEETPRENGYAISKYEGEMEVWRGIAEGLNAVVVNPSVIIGANAGIAGSGVIFNKVRSGLKYYPLGSVGFVDVEDVAKAMIALMNSGVKAERYIINGENRDYKSIFAEAAACFGVEPPASEAKPWMLGLAWRASAVFSALVGKPRGIDKITAQAGSKNLNYDNSKIKKAIGLNFKPLSQSIGEICTALNAG